MTDPLAITRRHFLSGAAMGLGSLGLSSILDLPTAAQRPNMPGKVKRVIYLFQSGGPAAQELFDYKPLLNEKHGEPLPDSVRGQQRLTGMSANQAILPLAGSVFKFGRHG